jgi:hypothetical protein
MIARRGHVALVLPNFARGHKTPTDIGKYEYLGDFKWVDHSSSKDFLYIGILA